eukprot:CAMPEP_0194777334 /NCGR_PEP_ID=MMETSP0323_2-20130528/65377_1 /TAXON_ID=2866 ORGANISM="Crypthecodinium cohnii, Strain Seligo" /NCGR_SAMPLE_ID=MMETSP0323_2 /ASSEMBLY_ACC=CAM_ASM_000346 /LENGTH=162 /DNA_ID=CAMNT_0039714091 /DNA_START=1 /DNA_END=486 /DNA_ORIENTATION=+
MNSKSLLRGMDIFALIAWWTTTVELHKRPVSIAMYSTPNVQHVNGVAAFKLREGQEAEFFVSVIAMRQGLRDTIPVKAIIEVGYQPSLFLVEDWTMLEKVIHRHFVQLVCCPLTLLFEISFKSQTMLCFLVEARGHNLSTVDPEDGNGLASNKSRVHPQCCA